MATTEENTSDSELGAEGSTETQATVAETSENQQEIDTAGDGEEEGDGGESPSGDEGETPQKPEGQEKPQTKVERKIGKLTRQKREALEAAAYYAEENAKLRAQLAKPALPKEAFPDEEAWVQDRIARQQAEGVSRNLQQRENQSAEQYHTVLYQEWAEKEQDLGVSAMPDYQARVAHAAQGMAPHVKLALYENPVGPALAYELAKDPEELLLLNRMPPEAVKHALFRMERDVTRPTAKTPTPVRKPTTVAEPMPRSSGTPATPRVRNLEELSGDKYLQAYRAEQARKRSAASKR